MRWERLFNGCERNFIRYDASDTRILCINSILKGCLYLSFSLVRLHKIGRVA